MYEGGYKIMRRARDFLHRLDGEKLQRYEDRLRLVSYIGYLAHVIDSLCAGLFESGVAVTEAVDADDPQTPGAEPRQKEDFWQDFAGNADLERTPFSSVLRMAVRDALLKSRALIVCDFPTVEDADKIITSRADEKALGVDRGYCYNLELEKLVDWETDDQGNFTWCILYEQTTKRGTPNQLRNLITHTWTLWKVGELDPKTASQEVQQFVRSDGSTPVTEQAGEWATWEKYELTVPSDFNQWKDELEIPMVDQGTTSFNRIPIISLELPNGLWAGNYLGPMAREHWTRRSYLVGAEARNMTAIGYVNLDTSGQGVPVDPEPATQRALRDRGVDLVLPGSLMYAEPNANAYKAVDEQLKDLKDEIYRVAHMMAMSVDNSSSTMRRSGDSKQQDKKDIAVVLGALAQYAKDYAVEVYETIANARKEDDVVWTAHGLDKFVDDDRNELLQEAVQIDLIGIPSPTWKKEYKTQTALRLTPNLPPETQDVIRKEIQDGVEDEQELDDLMLDQQKEEVQNTPTPQDQLDAQTKVGMAAAKNGVPAAGAPPGKGGSSGGAKAGAAKGKANGAGAKS